ncbi:unnamed protein product [Lactuca saligna]|uniref:Uncharacterized protein n=1 Tax=Lactuca saligna TaxID=75948 RepID=A0AA35YWP1_LACSI|nr:unnamed protein product [Lactuca saligna]
MAIVATYGQVVVPFVVDQTVPFKLHIYQLDENSSSDDDRTDDEGFDDDDGTIIAENNNELEEGEIGTMDVDRVMESNRGNLSNTANNTTSPVAALFPKNISVDKNDRRIKRDRHKEHQSSDGETNV